MGGWTLGDVLFIGLLLMRWWFTAMVGCFGATLRGGMEGFGEFKMGGYIAGNLLGRLVLPRRERVLPWSNPDLY